MPKVIAYAAFQLSLSHWLVFTETVLDKILKTLGRLMKKSDSQPRLFMFSTTSSFKLMKSNPENEIMKNVVHQNKIEQLN